MLNNIVLHNVYYHFMLAIHNTHMICGQISFSNILGLVWCFAGHFAFLVAMNSVDPYIIKYTKPRYILENLFIYKQVTDYCFNYSQDRLYNTIQMCSGITRG